MRSVRRGKVVLVAFSVLSIAAVPGAGLQAGETTRASVSTSGAQADFGNSYAAALSATARFVAFESEAYHLVPTDNGQTHVYLRDRTTPLTERVSVSSTGVLGNFGGIHPAVSADGLFVAFQSQSTNLVSPATPFSRFHVYLRDRQTGTTVLVSATAAGDRGNSHSYWPSITPDGRFIAFESLATNLTNPPTNGQRHILRYDRLTGDIVQVSLHDDGSQAPASCYHPSISDDGNLVAFHALTTLESRVIGGQSIYVRDIAGANTELVSLSFNGLYGANSHSYDPAISGDGWKVAFHSDATDLIDDVWNGRTHVYVRDRHGIGHTLRASVTGSGAQGNGYSWHAAINRDGTIVAFESIASDLVAGDTNGSSDIFVHREFPAAVHRLSVPNDALGDPEGNGRSWFPSISADGWFLAFESWATDLVAGDTNSFADIFVRDIAAGATSIAPSADTGPGRSLSVWPNPVRAGSPTEVRYDLSSNAGGRLAIYDVTGRPVTLLVNGLLSTGTQSLSWEGRDQGLMSRGV